MRPLLQTRSRPAQVPFVQSQLIRYVFAMLIPGDRLMLRIVRCAALVLVLVGCATTQNSSPRSLEDRTAASPPGNALLQAVNEYRQRRGLPPVPLSPALTHVAATLAADLEANLRDGGECNVHSWSTSRQRSDCCYTNDHVRSSCRWERPKQFRGESYGMPGYEIAAWYSKATTSAQAIKEWRDSEAHAAMLLNQEQWADAKWRAVGVALSGHYAVVWFGETTDQGSGSSVASAL